MANHVIFLKKNNTHIWFGYFNVIALFSCVTHVSLGLHAAGNIWYNVSGQLDRIYNKGLVVFVILLQKYYMV